MYTDIESMVINNVNSGQRFKLQSWVRQGCPLSAYLLITALETLDNKIRNEKTTINGIKIDNREITISLLADDITSIALNLNL